MPRRNNPFGPKNRPLPRSLRNKLSKEGVKPIKTSDPAEAPMKRYHGRLRKFVDPVVTRTKEVLSDLFGRYGGRSDREGVLGFIGEFLYTIGLLRSESDQQDRQDEVKNIAGEFSIDVGKDQKQKFERDSRGIGLQVVKQPFDDKDGNGKNVLAVMGEAVFQNVNLIKSLDTRYFNDIQRMVFEQIGIKIPEPKKSIPGKKNNRLSLRKTLQATPTDDPQVFTPQEMVLLALPVLKAAESKGGIVIPHKESMVKKILEMNEDLKQYEAERIARDQTQKVFSALEEARGRDAGMTWYLWSDSDDNRERESHRKNHNKIFHIDFPPEETGPPGRDVNCRCRRKWLVARSQIQAIKESDLGKVKNQAGLREQLRKDQGR